MIVLLLGIGFAAGVVTAISPCVLPVLPIVLAGGASGGRRRPYAIVAGLVASFSLATLFAAWLLGRLGLPQDLLRNVAIGLLFLLAVTLVFPRVGELVERPFARLGRRPAGDLGGGFLLGASLGLVFVPCGGPVIAAITTAAASLDFGLATILLTVFYAAGAAVPLLLIARGSAAALRPRALQVRAALGVLMAAGALAIVFDLDRKAQTALGDYTGWFQKLERSSVARKELAKVRGPSSGVARAADQSSSIRDFGAAPDFRGISLWLNTPGGKPLSLKTLRGKVVLVDFWTYSCINCLRTLPHLEAWDRAYRKFGLVIVGVHTPEFAFEHVPSNVRKAVRDLGVRYPVALDNGYGTWNAWSNQYWPAEYLIDKRGHVRNGHAGEGEYKHTESLIRTLVAEPHARRVRVADTTPAGLLTPESYLGYSRLDRYAGSKIVPGQSADYELPAALPQNDLAYGGNWRVEAERIVAGPRARLRLHFHARKVYLVLGGTGSVDVLVDGRPRRRVAVAGSRLYTLVALRRVEDAVLELRFSAGVQAYAFTFG